MSRRWRTVWYVRATSAKVVQELHSAMTTIPCSNQQTESSN
jgi:hypothetical protein